MKYRILQMMFACFTSSVFAGGELSEFTKFGGFELEKTELKEIFSKIGDSPVHKEGDAGESYTGICYFYPAQNITVFYESGEMGGSTTLLSYKFLSGKTTRFPCTTIENGRSQTFTLGGVKIGQTLEAAELLLPLSPYSVQGNVYTYWNRIPFTEKDYLRVGADKSDNLAWDDMVTIEIYTNENIVTGYGVSRVITW